MFCWTLSAEAFGTVAEDAIESRSMEMPAAVKPKKAKVGLLLIGAMLAAVAALLIFGWLAEEVLESDTSQFDTVVRGFVHRLASPTATSVMQGFSFLGSVGMQMALTIGVVLLFLYTHRPRAASLLAITMAGAGVLDVVLKHAFHRVRPVPYFGASPSSFSFPSGHALGSLCFYGALALILSARNTSWRRQAVLWTAAALLTGMIGLSRIYLGVHYPSDVIAGYSAAVVWVAAVGFSDRMLKSR